MDDNLKEELDYTLELLIKSGFFSKDDIIEILEEQFIDEDIDINNIEIKFNETSNKNFEILEEAFSKISQKDIVAIHNCGYDIDEGIADSFELYVHLLNNKQNPIGFCFYTFEDIEECIFENKLRLTFSSFKEDEKLSLEIGNIIFDILQSFNLNIKWDNTINGEIIIEDFKWDKKLNLEKEYEVEGSYENYLKNH